MDAKMSVHVYQSTIQRHILSWMFPWRRWTEGHFHRLLISVGRLSIASSIPKPFSIAYWKWWNWRRSSWSINCDTWFANEKRHVDSIAIRMWLGRHFHFSGLEHLPNRWCCCRANSREMSATQSDTKWKMSTQMQMKMDRSVRIRERILWNKLMAFVSFEGELTCNRLIDVNDKPTTVWTTWMNRIVLNITWQSWMFLQTKVVKMHQFK